MNCASYITIDNRQCTLFALRLSIVLSSYMCKPPFEPIETLEIRVLSYKPLHCGFIQALMTFTLYWYIGDAFSLLWMHLKLFYIRMQLIFLSLSAACCLRASFCIESFFVQWHAKVREPLAENVGTGWRFFLFCRNIYIFPFSTALRKQQKIFACFPEDKLSTIYLDHQITKVFTPMHRVSFWSISECLNLFFNSSV